MSGWQRRRRSLAPFLFLLVCPALWAEPDDSQQAWLERVEIAPRWDNVEGAPEWVSGPQPEYRFGLSVHTLTLNPGQSVVLLLPAGERLRLHAPAGDMDWQAFELSWSNGSGLFAALEGTVDADGKSLLATPPAGQPALVRVSRRSTAVGAAEIALFISRDVNRVLAPGYREQLTPVASGPVVSLDDGRRKVRYWQTDRNAPLRVEVEGGSRVEIDSRLPFPEQEGAFAESYRLYAYLDGVPWRALDLATVLDTTAAVSVDGCVRPLGRQSRGYVDIPEGRHQLELRSRRSLYLRLLERRRPDDYLVDLNRPLGYEQTIGARGTGTGAHFWGLNERRPAHQTDWPAQPDTAAYLSAVRVAKDNSRRQGGLQATSVLARWAARYPGQERAQAMAGRRRSMHSFYRNLLPREPADGPDPSFAWFPTPRLLKKSDNGFYPDGYGQSLSGNLANGFFSRLPAPGEGTQGFLIPEEVQSSQLRVSVERSARSSSRWFYLQLDDREPIRLQIEPEPSLPAAAFRPGTGSIGLALLQRQSDRASSTLSGPFAARHEGAPLVSVGFIELPLEGPVRRVSVWRTEAGTEPLRVALAYRTSRWFQQSEAGYTGLLETLGSETVWRLFQKALVRARERSVRPAWQGQGAERSERQDSYFDLYNQWLPLLRLLGSRYALFSAGIQPVAATDDPPVHLDTAQIEGVIQQATAAEKSNDWQQALALWSRIQRATKGPRRAEARSRQIEALLRLGNAFLAEQLLRHDLLHALDPALKRQALERLITRYARAGDPDDELTLRVAAALADPTAAHLVDLAQALSATGHHSFALQILLALPSGERPEALLLAVSYDTGWWELFEQTLRDAKDSRTHSLWQGYRAQLNGDDEAALRYWAESGREGEELARQLSEGQAIRADLTAADEGRRRQAVLRWEEWQTATPGPRVWRPLPQAVIGHNGTEWVSVADQGGYFYGFRATPERPLSLGVYGPANLRIQLRPLHRSWQEAPINDWIRIRSNGEERRYPIVDNQASTALRLVGHPDLQPGQRVTIPYQVAAGYHELQLSGGQGEVIAEIDILRPEFPLAVLPPLSPQAVHRFLRVDSPDPDGVDGGEGNDRVWFHAVGQCGQTVPLPVRPLGGMPGNGERRLTIEPPMPEWFRLLDEARRDTADPLRGRTVDPVVEDRQTLADREVQDRLHELLWRAEREPDQALPALIEAEEQAALHPLVPGMEPMLRRLRRHASWKRVRTVQESAGVRLIETVGWQPEEPALKTRQAITGLNTDTEQVLSGHDTRVLAMHNLKPVEIRLGLSMVEAGYQPTQSMRVLITLDQGAETEVVLSGRRPESVLVRQVGAGHHQFRIRIAQPVANQYLRIRVNERVGNVSRVVSLPVQRSYEVVTPEQPLVLLLEGPARLRIDEWRDGGTRIRYRSLQAGWQKVVLTVEEGREEALLRVFRRVLEPDKPAVSPRRFERLTEPVPGPLRLSLAPARAFEPGPADPLPLGGQEDGTWSLLAALVSRRAVDDEPRESRDAERFLALGSAYRYFSSSQDTYYQADGRVRIREHGDPTLALRGWMDIRRPDWPVDLDLAGSLFAQHLDDSAGTESALTLRARFSRRMELGPKTSHRPFVSLFGRWMSLRDLPDSDPDKVDQDVFTRYKHDHKRGLRIGDRIEYRPWVDHVLYAGAYLASNEDLNLLDPDHLRLGVGARQFIADVRLAVDYGWFNYYEDDDRSRDSNTQRFRAELGIDRWVRANAGLQADFRYEYDRDADDSSFWLTLAWNRSNGRYYRDYRPGDLDFLALRKRRALERQTSGVVE